MVFRRLRKEKHFSGFRRGARGMAFGVGVVYQKWKRISASGSPICFLNDTIGPF